MKNLFIVFCFCSVIQNSAHAQNWSVNVNGISISTDKNNLSTFTEFWDPVKYMESFNFLYKNPLTLLSLSPY